MQKSFFYFIAFFTFDTPNMKLGKGLFNLIIASLFFYACAPKKNKSVSQFSYHPLGYYYQLLAFEQDTEKVISNRIAWLSATFKTQADSIFWDSFNNMNDKFYLSGDTSSTSNFIAHRVSRLQTLDSMCLLIKPSDFFSQQFKFDSVPFFSENDSVVKVNILLKKWYTTNEFRMVKENLLAQELKQIHNYFTTEAEANAAMDPMGYYWIFKEGLENTVPIKPGQRVSISYEGYFLNGRFLEKSADNFEFRYGTPDQLLKGLNYVIGTLKLGQTAKIILPSPLAFGENGSTNGIVPPYTPLLYQVKIIEIKD